MDRSELLARLVAQAFTSQERREIGILVRQIPYLEGKWVLMALDGLRGGPNGVRIALLGVGDPDANTRDAVELGYLPDQDFTTQVEVAESWRNQPGLSNIVVVAAADLPKLTSFAELGEVSSADLKRLLCKRAGQEISAFEEHNNVQITWWDQLAHDDRVSLAESLDYYLAQVDLPFAERLQSSTRDLWKLGLIPDNHLFDSPQRQGIRRRVTENRQLMDTISQMTPSTRKKVADRIAREPNQAQRQRFGQVFRDIQALYDGGGQALQRLQMEDVMALLSLRTGGPTPPRRQKVDIDSYILELILNPEFDHVGEFPEQVTGWIETLLEELKDIRGDSNSKPTSITIEDISTHVLVATGRTDIMDLITIAIDEGRLSVSFATDQADCQNSLRQAHNLEQIGEVTQGKIQRYLEHIATTEQGRLLKSRFDALMEARSLITSEQNVHFVDGLLTAPLLMLSDADNREMVQEYVTAYERLCEEMVSGYQSLSAAFDDNVRDLYSLLVLMDIILFSSPHGTYALMSPLHPLWLWHYTHLLDCLIDPVDSLTQTERDLIAKRILPMSTLIESLSATEPFTGGGTLTLLLAGNIGYLPYYEDQGLRSTPDSRFNAISSLVNDFVGLFPYAKQGLRVVALEPPNVGTLLQAVSDIADEHDIDGIRLSVFSKTAEGQNFGANLLDDEEQEINARFGSRMSQGRFSLEINNAGGEWTTEQIVDYRPHIVLAFGQGTRRAHTSRSGTQAAHPLVTPHSFHYSIVEGQIVLRPEPGGIIGSFYEAARQIGNGAGLSYAEVHQDQQTRQRLEELASEVPWLVLIDQNIDNDFEPGSLRLYTGQDGELEVAAFSQSKQRFRDILREVVQDYNTAVTDAQLDDLLSQLSGLLRDGIRGLRPSDDSQVDFTRIKGMIGTLFAALWYQSETTDQTERIILSLDDAEARQWLDIGGQDTRRADLLGIEWDKDQECCVVDVIEVKAVNDPSGEYRLSNGFISGEAVQQLLQTAGFLRPVFDQIDDTDTITTPFRRELLKRHLQHECSKGIYSEDDRSRWSTRLTQLFHNQVPAQVRNTLVWVSIGAVVDPTPSTYQAAGDNWDPIFDENGAPLQVTLVHLSETSVESLVYRVPDGVPGPEQPVAHPVGGPSATDDQSGVSAPGDPESPEFPDPTGDQTPQAEDGLRVMLGHPLPPAAQGQEVWYDPFRLGSSLSNPHIMITGQTGTGKTQAIKAITHEIGQAERPLMFLDFKDDYSDPDYVEQERLQVFNTSLVGLPFNPLRPSIDQHSGMVMPMAHIYQVGGILRRVLGLGVQQEDRLRQAIRQAYHDVGLGEENFRFEQEFNIPEFATLRGILEATPGNRELCGRLAPLFDLNLFQAGDTNRTQLESLMESRVVIRLGLLPDDQTKAIVAEFLLMALYNYLIGRPRPIGLGRMLVLDEAWRIANSPFLEPLLREGRGLGLGVIIASQYPKDLGSVARGSANTKIFFANDQPEDVRLIQQMILGATSGREATALATDIRRFQPFQCIATNDQYRPYSRIRFLPYFERD